METSVSDVISLAVKDVKKQPNVLSALLLISTLLRELSTNV